jgi:hypothetical protein
MPELQSQELDCDRCAEAEQRLRNVRSGFNGTRQLVDGGFQYRRTGVLGLEKNSQGAVPVVLALQQLEINLSGMRSGNVFAPSYDLVPLGGVPPSRSIWSSSFPAQTSTKQT